MVGPWFTVFDSSLLVWIGTRSGLCTYPCILLVVSSRIYTASANEVSFSQYFQDLPSTTARASYLSEMAVVLILVYSLLAPLYSQWAYLAITFSVVPWFTVNGRVLNAFLLTLVHFSLLVSSAFAVSLIDCHLIILFTEYDSSLFIFIWSGLSVNSFLSFSIRRGLVWLSSCW